MSYLLLAAGTFVLVLVFLEMLWTTMGMGSGIITRFVSGSLWRVLVTLHRVRPSHLLLTWGGIAVLLLVVSTWILFLWTGWSLIFLASEASVIHTYSDQAATVVDQIYFTGFTISTLGVGDFAPQGAVWQLLTALASLSGLFFVTLSVTYLVPIVSAVTSARETAVHISSLGLNPYEIVLRHCGTEDCASLEKHVGKINTSLLTLEQQYLTYPILHYFHIPLRPESIVLSIALLDEALTLLFYAPRKDQQIASSELRLTRQIITEFLDTLSGSFVRASDNPPPMPSLKPLQDILDSEIDQETFDSQLGTLAKRRSLLRGLVENEGWQWNDIYNRSGDSSGESPLTRVEPSIKAGEEAE